MRVQHRGGLWTNAEDEVLKAALQKYGSNQWSRIASLLPRKSAKQVKARWNEWLSPSIRKTEWTREEEERLLHLAKIMPTQWRTIAPMVGRTAAQCLEHYETLLEDAQRGSAAGSASDALAAAGDARRARHDHEIAAESKPARPDAVDMNEEEKEMLSEARARLANTRGKKAKRKAREKQLEAAKRLAQLQKRRELKAAGIEMKPRKRKGGGYDLATEIPFARAAVPGFYDTQEEERANAADTRDARGVGRLITKYDAERVEDFREKEGQKNERKRTKVFGNFRTNPLVSEVEGAPISGSASGDPPIKRSKLSLPAPQVSDTDLEVIAKAGASTLTGESSGDDGYGSAGLLSGARHPLLATPTGSISTSLATTPRTTSAHGERWADARDRQLRDMAKLQAATTPLVGGDSTALPASLDVHGSVTPRSTVQRTPSVMATPSVVSLGTLASRDMNDKELARAEKARLQLLRRELKKGLVSLPDPENEYELNVGAVGTGNTLSSDGEEFGIDDTDFVEDAEDEVRRIAREGKKLLAETKKRAFSLAASRYLPRPTLTFLQRENEVSPSARSLTRIVSELVQRDNLVTQVLEQLSEKVEEKVPDIEAARRVKEGVTLDPDDGSLEGARRLVAEEVERMRDGTVASVSEREILEAVKQQSAAFSKAFWVSKDGRTVVEAKRGEDMKESFRQGSVHASLKLKAVRTQQKNIQMRMGGFESKHEALTKELSDVFNQLTKARQELVCFSMLAEEESSAIPRRIAEMETAIERENVLHKQLQYEYAQCTGGNMAT